MLFYLNPDWQIKILMPFLKYSKEDVTIIESVDDLEIICSSFLEHKTCLILLRMQFLLKVHTTKWKVLADNVTSIMPVKFWPGYPAFNRQQFNII